MFEHLTKQQNSRTAVCFKLHVLKEGKGQRKDFEPNGWKLSANIIFSEIPHACSFGFLLNPRT
jgi:hypothetical protein